MNLSHTIDYKNIYPAEKALSQNSMQGCVGHPIGYTLELGR